MIFSVAQIVAHLSCYMTLNPGDLITTGTPPGVGAGVKPNPVFLKPGDTMVHAPAQLSHVAVLLTVPAAPFTSAVPASLPCVQ